MQTPLLIIGSSNTDMVVRTDRFPQPGETLLGGDFFLFSGGKGANQAVAAARLGGQVTFVCKVGNDLFGQNSLTAFQQEGINTDYALIDPQTPSGVALITVNRQGQNSIVVAPGANAQFTEEEITALAGLIEAAVLIVLQLEIPMPVVEAVLDLARLYHKRVILNPAPAVPLPKGVYQNLFMLTPNETEAHVLTGISVTDESSARQAALHFNGLGVQNVIITLGERGVYLSTEAFQELLPAPVVQAVDTTAAGDVFNGALAVAMMNQLDLRAAAQFACRAAALSVTRLGAQTSAPYRHEVEEFFVNNTH